MKFWQKLLISIGVNAVLGFLLYFGAANIDVSVDIIEITMFTFPSLVAVIGAVALCVKGERRIWYLPLSQAIIFAGVLAYMAVRFIYPHIDSFLLAALISFVFFAFWIIPSTIAAGVFEIIRGKRIIKKGDRVKYAK